MRRCGARLPVPRCYPSTTGLFPKLLAIAHAAVVAEEDSASDNYQIEENFIMFQFFQIHGVAILWWESTFPDTAKTTIRMSRQAHQVGAAQRMAVPQQQGTGSYYPTNGTPQPHH